MHTANVPHMIDQYKSAEFGKKIIQTELSTMDTSTDEGKKRKQQLLWQYNQIVENQKRIRKDLNVVAPNWREKLNG